MALTWPVVAAVLVGACCHAGWNALVKSSPDQPLENALLNLIGSIVALPLLLWTGLPPAASWPYLGASIVVHIAYHFMLTGAYRHGELGLTYPLMRGSAPLLLALASAGVLGEPLSPAAWAGVLAVSCGVLALGLSRHALRAPRAVAFALANAVVIATYTAIDGTGVRAGGDPLRYVLAFFALDGWAFGALVLARRGAAASWQYAQRRAHYALGGAIASLLSYGIALWAMTRAPLATVAALRETSVLFAAWIGTAFLREAFTPRRALGTLAILAGVLALRLA